MSSAGSSPLRRRRPRFRPDLRSGSSRPRSNAARNWWHGPAAGHRARRWSVASVADRMRPRLRRVPLHIIVFILPAAAIYTAFMIYPLFDSLRLSLHGNPEGGGVVFVGLQNYARLGAHFRPWLGLEGSALVTLSLISVWQFVGIPLMLFHAALIGIPDDLLEAARVDGATGWRAFWGIEFPLILPVVGLVAILTYVGNFNAFDLIYTAQGALAGPNFSTDILGTFFYRTFFGFQLQLGNPFMGATVAGVMFLLILAGVLPYLFVWQRRIEVHEL